MSASLPALFGSKKPFIGMVHLRPSVGYAEYPGDEAYVAHAVAEARALVAGSADAMLIENDRDKPHAIVVSAAQRECIQRAVAAVRAEVQIPVGVGVLLNDWKAALDIAHATGSAFVRIDVFVDRVQCPDGQGVIEPAAADIVAYRAAIGAQDVAIFADIQVKHKILLEEGKPLVTSAQQAIDAGADAIIVTGPATGHETPLADIALVKSAFPHFPVLVGAGVNEQNVIQQLRVADGAIVGTSLKNAEDLIDPVRVQKLKNAIESL